LITIVAFQKYRSGEINYYNSDATWHTLLTIKAYNETPISIHKFLPIVSLGEIDDKGISWGATIPDNRGNYYYTSFSPAGYILPYLFMKVFHLPVSERSLYIFNSLLFIVSGALWACFISQVYKESKNVHFISLIALLTYVFSPELLHGMGVVYWHQSIMQITLLIQIIAYYNMKVNKEGGGQFATIIFYIITLINPYIEWTGYVVNIGFILAEFILYWKNNKKKAFIKVTIISCLTMLSFSIFISHYLLVVDSTEFFQALKARFMARNITSSTSLTDVFGGYLKSFLYLWVLIFILAIWNFVKIKNITPKYGLIYLVLTFSIVENIIMKEHALSYSYDRMKFVYILSFISCELIHNLIENTSKKRMVKSILLCLTAIFGILNLKSYISSTKYIWEVDYRQSNQILAEYINKNYSDSIMAISNKSVRGYVNLLFDRGVYEWTSMDKAKSIAEEKQKRYIVMLNVKDNSWSWNLYNFSGATIYDLVSNKTTEISINNNLIDAITFDTGKTVYRLADWTDENWTNGYSNTSNILLFNRQDTLLINLLAKKYIAYNNERYIISKVDFDNKWIRVTVDRDASNCMYPSLISIE